MNIAAFEGLTPLEIFRKLAPEFAAVPDEVVQGYIDLASLFVCEDEYGDAYNVALALMAAHIMASPLITVPHHLVASSHARRVIWQSLMETYQVIPITSAGLHTETCCNFSARRGGQDFLL